MPRVRTGASSSFSSRTATHPGAVKPRLRIPFGALLLLGVLAGACPTLLNGQASEGLAPGTRVRLSAPGIGRRVVHIAEWRSDTLAVVDHGRPVAVPISTIQRLEISHGRAPRLKSAIVGAGLGTLSGMAGGILGVLVPTLVAGGSCDPDESTDDFCLGTAAWVVIGAAIGAPMGAASGLVAGALLPWERWQLVTGFRRPRAGSRSVPGGVGIGLSVRVP